MTPCVILIVCVRLTGRCIFIPNTLFMETTMKREKDTAVRCVYIALRWSAGTSGTFFYSHCEAILLGWSKETFERSGFSSRQRRDISIGADVSDKGTPAACYVLDRFDMVTLIEYLHILDRCATIFPALYGQLLFLKFRRFS